MRGHVPRRIPGNTGTRELSRDRRERVRPPACTRLVLARSVLDLIPRWRSASQMPTNSSRGQAACAPARSASAAAAFRSVPSSAARCSSSCSVSESTATYSRTSVPLTALRGAQRLSLAQQAVELVRIDVVTVLHPYIMPACSPAGSARSARRSQATPCGHAGASSRRSGFKTTVRIRPPWVGPIISTDP